MTVQIKKITIENFRGIRLPIEIDFLKNGTTTSVLVYGRNGVGKSSVIDAWEWIINNRIEHLAKEWISEKDYPHKLSNWDNCYVQVDIKHPTATFCRVNYNKNRTATPTISWHHSDFKALAIYPNYLRYSDLQSFVFQTKGEKYKYITKFFWLEEFSKKQSDLQASVTRIGNLLEQNDSQLKSNISILGRNINSDIIDDEKILAHVNTVALKYKLDTITEINQLNTVKNAMFDIVKANPIAVELAWWKAFDAKLKTLYPLPSIESDSLEIDTIFSELKADQANITNLILLELYDKAVEIIPKLEQKNQCPVCDNLFDGNLEEHVSIKHLALSTLNWKKESYLNFRNRLVTNLESIRLKLSIINNETNEKVLKEFKAFFDDISIITDHIPEIIGLLKTSFKEIEILQLSSDSKLSKVASLINSQSSYEDFIQVEIKRLSEDETSKNLANDFDNLVQIISTFSDYQKNQKKVIYLRGVHQKLSKLLSKLTLYIQDQIQATFDAIQVNLTEYYNYLESSNIFLKNPKIKLVPGKDKAIELEIEFAGENISPAYKFMSESQINSFGLSIFLAAVKHFNSEFKFFILDDIVNSFDAFKRPKVAELLADKFQDFQVLLFTHDLIFFDTIQRSFPQWNRHKIISWDYNLWPKYIVAKNYSEEITEFLAQDDPISAGQRLGRHMEMIFGILNENLQTPIRYKLDNTYTLSEFYEPFVARLKKKIPWNDLLSLFDNFEQWTIFRNYCMHWKNEPSQFTTPEISDLFVKLTEIESLIYCNVCKTYIWLENIGNTEYIKCKCGNCTLST